MNILKRVSSDLFLPYWVVKNSQKEHHHLAVKDEKKNLVYNFERIWKENKQIVLNKKKNLLKTNFSIIPEYD
jgi:hypothetical protein